MGNLAQWIPDRKVASGGIVAVAAYFLLQLLAQWAGPEFAFEPEVQAQIIGGAAFAAAYLMPLSIQGVLKRGDDFLADLYDAIGERTGKAPAGGNGGTNFGSLVLVCVIAGSLLAVAACDPGSVFSVEDEVNQPTTEEQRAFAKVGQFRVLQVTALEVMRDPLVADDVKTAVADSEAIAYAAFLAYVDSVRTGATVTDQQFRLATAAAAIGALETLLLAYAPAAGGADFVPVEPPTAPVFLVVYREAQL